MKGIKFEKKDGSKLSVGIVVARWNNHITDALLKECKRALLECDVLEKNIKVLEVPGSFEVVYGANLLAKSKKVDVIVCLGCLVKGETMHFEYIAEGVSQGIARLNSTGSVPVIFGVLTCLTEEQALSRSVGPKNEGYGWGMAAVEMGLLKF